MHTPHGSTDGRQRAFHDGTSPFKLLFADDSVGLEVRHAKSRATSAHLLVWNLGIICFHGRLPSMAVLHGPTAGRVIEVAGKSIIVLSRTFAESAETAWNTIGGVRVEQRTREHTC